MHKDSHKVQPTWYLNYDFGSNERDSGYKQQEHKRGRVFSIMIVLGVPQLLGLGSKTIIVTRHNQQSTQMEFQPKSALFK
jgi:hypothetical protein